MQFFYGVCFLLTGMGLPLLAKSSGADIPTPSFSSKSASKTLLPKANRSSVAQAKAITLKKAEIVVTSDKSRAAASLSLAAKQESSSQVLKCGQPLVGQPILGDRIADASGQPIRSEQTTEDIHNAANTRLARVTAYWASEGDYYTGRGISSTGVRLHDGHCAVDPNIIPYGSVVEIAGVGKYLAVDTGSAVVSRTAAREGGHTSAERNAIVVDVYFEDASEGERFAAGAAKYVSISWWTPSSVGVEARAARSLFADENWTKIQSKQL